MAQRTPGRVQVRNAARGERTDWISRLANRNNVTVRPDGCWQAGDDPSRYTRAMVTTGQYDYLHRLAYLAVNGPIPDGWQIHHRCEMPACINPDHLEAVTPLDHKARHAESRSR